MRFRLTHLIHHVNLIEKFLNTYRIHDKHPDLFEIKGSRSTNHLLDHIKRQNEKNMSHGIWNVAIIEPSTGNESGISLGKIGKVKMVNRSIFQTVGQNNDADIKALMSKGDLKIDLPEGIEVESDWAAIKAERMNHPESARPMLLLYAIDKNSEPKRKGKANRQKLDAVMDVLAFGMVFPGLDTKTETMYYVQVDVEEDTEYEEIEAVDNE